jgi:hypothetical protein
MQNLGYERWVIEIVCMYMDFDGLLLKVCIMIHYKKLFNL